MAVPKDAGLSHPADIGRIELHYPIKKRGERRRLSPNSAGIEWLEASTETETELLEYAGDWAGDASLQAMRALGWARARIGGLYPRPMFQLVATGEGVPESGSRYRDPCPDCDDWSRTARCAEHHDRDGIRGLKMGGVRQMERSELPLGYFSASLSPDRGVPVPAASVNIYDRITQADIPACTCSLCQSPQAGPVGYIDRRLARIDALPDASITFEGAVEVEIDSETVQGVRSFTIYTGPPRENPS
jgi:hypothetical protein